MVRFLPVAILIAVLVAPVFGVSAHTEPELTADGVKETQQQIEAVIVEPDLFFAQTATTVWLSVKDKADGHVIENLSIVAVVQDEEGHEIFKGAAEPKAAEGEQTFYFFETAFPSGGNYKILYAFVHNDEDVSLAFPIMVVEPEKEAFVAWDVPTIATTVLVAGILVALLLWGIIKKQYKKMLLLLAAVLFLAIVGYSLLYTVRSGALQSGVITCLDDGRCFWTAHVHAYIVPRICGEERRLAAEVGALQRTHTHEERNILHWHDRLLYDNTAKRLLATEPLTLGASFDEVNVPFEQGNAFDAKDGDQCPDGTEGSWKMFVNGKQYDGAFRDYIWKHLDVIVLIFDARSPEAIEGELRVNPIAFPALGRG